MKKILLSAFAIAALTFNSSAQCAPDAHNWGTTTFGVYPDPSQGQSFQQGYLNLPYSDVVYVKTPTNAQDVVPTLIFPVPIDSLHLDGIDVVIGTDTSALSTIGLNVTCNNNGVSPDPCMFMPGGAYCGDIAGTPNQAGNFPVTINATVYITVFGTSTPVPYQFTNYILTILDGTGVASIESKSLMELGQNTPNPANVSADIPFDLAKSSQVEIVVTNLLGEKVHTALFNGKRGQNTYRVVTSELESGIYLYSISTEGRKITRRMVVQH
jgi:hypothetical protein